jgi:hypothetical protein
MRHESLADTLNALPQRSPSAARLAADVVPPFVAWLEIDPGWVRFEYPFIYGAGRVRVADAAVIDPELDRALLIFEVREARHRDRVRDEFFNLTELRDVTGAYAGILLTTMDLTVRGTVEANLKFGELTPGDLEWLRAALREGFATWHARAAPHGRRRAPPHRGRPGKRPECEAMLQATRDASTNDEKKKSLEGLVRFLIERNDYLRVKYTDVRTASSEIDLVVENRGRSRHTMFDEFGRHFLIECKNWNQPVGAKEVRDFVGKLLKTKIRLGILATRQGVTGSGGGEDALREIHFCFDTLQTAVLVLTEEDFEALCSGIDFHDLLDQKLDRLRFDLP